MHITFHDSLPQKYKTFDPKDAHDFWTHLKDVYGGWVPIVNHDRKVIVESFEKYNAQQRLGQGEMHIWEVQNQTGNHVIMVQIEHLIYKLNEESKERNSKVHDMRTNRRFPDWREVINPQEVLSKSRNAIYSSITHMKKRYIDAEHLQFHVSESLTKKPDAQGYYPFMVTPKEGKKGKKVLTYSAAYTSKLRLEKKGLPIPPRIGFEVDKCPRGEREVLRPYFNLLLKLEERGKLAGGELRDLYEMPVSASMNLRDIFNDGTRHGFIKNAYGIDTAVDKFKGIAFPKPEAPRSLSATITYPVTTSTTAAQVNPDKPKAGLTYDTYSAKLTKEQWDTGWSWLDEDFGEDPQEAYLKSISQSIHFNQTPTTPATPATPAAQEPTSTVHPLALPPEPPGWPVEQRLTDFRVLLAQIIEDYKNMDPFMLYDNACALLNNINTVYSIKTKEVLVKGLSLEFSDLMNEVKAVIKSTGCEEKLLAAEKQQKAQIPQLPGFEDWPDVGIDPQLKENFTPEDYMV